MKVDCVVTGMVVAIFGVVFVSEVDFAVIGVVLVCRMDSVVTVWVVVGILVLVDCVDVIELGIVNLEVSRTGPNMLLPSDSITSISVIMSGFVSISLTLRYPVANPLCEYISL